jgi:hypothetical protein
MRYIKLFENFRGDKVKYFVNRVGNCYRIFALTPKMMSDGVKEPQDAEDLFGKGSVWIDYDYYEDAENIIKSLDSDEYEHEEGDYNNESKVNEEFETDDISQSLSDWWISCDEQLPENRQLVIIYAPKSHMSKINICRFEMGISAKEREELRLSGDENLVARGRAYSGADEHANNRKPYKWDVQGPGSYFGQDVTHWMPIPDSPDSDYRV